jgi:hypothetical protein
LDFDCLIFVSQRFCAELGLQGQIKHFGTLFFFFFELEWRAATVGAAISSGR